MADLVAWYRNEEQKKQLSVVELAALFHYRYIRIHPFEDGNGRIARLIVNYILYRHGYPMIVIPTADRRNYLDVLGKCDKTVGALPFDGANANIDRIKPFVDYISAYVERKLQFAIDLIEGTIPVIVETDTEQQKEPVKPNDVSVNVSVNVSVKNQIIEVVGQFPDITVKELAKILSVTERTVYRQIEKLKTEGKLQRIGSDKTGFWRIK